MEIKRNHEWTSCIVVEQGRENELRKHYQIVTLLRCFIAPQLSIKFNASINKVWLLSFAFICVHLILFSFIFFHIVRSENENRPVSHIYKHIVLPFLHMRYCMHARARDWWNGHFCRLFDESECRLFHLKHHHQQHTHYHYLYDIAIERGKES